MSKFAMIREWVGKNKVLAGLTAASLAIAGYSERDVILPHTSAVVSQESVASKPLGSKIEGQMTVASGITLSNITLLNDKKYNPQDSSIVTLAVPKELCPDAKAMVGKTIHFVGTRSEYRGKAQVQVNKLEVK